MFIADAIKKWLGESSVETLYIEPGYLWQNGYIKSFNGNLRNEVLDMEIFHSIREAKVLVENWRLGYNNHRPHIGLNDKTPAEFAADCIASATPQQYIKQKECNSLITFST